MTEGYGDIPRRVYLLGWKENTDKTGRIRTYTVKTIEEDFKGEKLDLPRWHPLSLSVDRRLLFFLEDGRALVMNEVGLGALLAYHFDNGRKPDLDTIMKISEGKWTSIREELLYFIEKMGRTRTLPTSSSL